MPSAPDITTDGYHALIIPGVSSAVSYQDQIKGAVKYTPHTCGVLCLFASVNCLGRISPTCTTGACRSWVHTGRVIVEKTPGVFEPTLIRVDRPILRVVSCRGNSAGVWRWALGWHVFGMVWHSIWDNILVGKSRCDVCVCVCVGGWVGGGDLGS